MEEEWVVVVVEATPLDGGAARPTVGICQVSVSDPRSDMAICPDEESAAYEAAAIADVLGLPLYDGADPDPRPLDAERFIDRDWDGTDRYWELAERARDGGAPRPPVKEISAPGQRGRREADAPHTSGMRARPSPSAATGRTRTIAALRGRAAFDRGDDR